MHFEMCKKTDCFWQDSIKKDSCLNCLILYWQLYNKFTPVCWVISYWRTVADRVIDTVLRSLAVSAAAATVHWLMQTTWTTPPCDQHHSQSLSLLPAPEPSIQTHTQSEWVYEPLIQKHTKTTMNLQVKVSFHVAMKSSKNMQLLLNALVTPKKWKRQ